MNTLPLNTEGYDKAAVSNVTNFGNTHFALAHGSGDDNGTSYSWIVALQLTVRPVHFANTAHLIDLFTQERVNNYRFRMFTDRFAVCLRSVILMLTMCCSDHGIYTRNANRELYEWITAFLYEHWGKGGVRRGW